MLTLMVALRPENEAPRDSRSRAARGTTNYVNSNAQEHTIIEHRTQRLTAAFGLPILRARLIADLAWEGGHGRA